MEESNEQDGMVEILDLENDMIDGYVSEETEGMVFCIPWIFQFPKPNFSVLLSFIAQLTTILEYNDKNEDSFWPLDETTNSQYRCPLCKEM